MAEQIKSTVASDGQSVTFEITDSPEPNGDNSMLAQILALIAALKAQDWLTAFKILLDLMSKIASQQIPASEIDDAHANIQRMVRSQTP